LPAMNSPRSPRDIEAMPSRASPAPTLDRWCCLDHEQIDKPVYRCGFKPVCTAPTTCGSWLACDAFTSVPRGIEAMLSRASPAPTLDRWCCLDHDKSTSRVTGVPASPSARHRPPVGAGLPAMHSPRHPRGIEVMPSRASPAPTQGGSGTLPRSRTNRQTGLPVWLQARLHDTDPLWELACLRCIHLGTPGVSRRCHRGQARLPHWIDGAAWITNKSTNRFTGVPASLSARHRPPVGAGLPAMNSPRCPGESR